MLDNNKNLLAISYQNGFRSVRSEHSYRGNINLQESDHTLPFWSFEPDFDIFSGQEC